MPAPARAAVAVIGAGVAGCALVALCQEHLQDTRLAFRSDRDGPLPQERSGATA